MKGRRIAMVIRELGCGGAQRVLCTLSEGLVRLGNEVHVLTLSSRVPDFLQLPPGVHRHHAGPDFQETFEWHEVRSRWRHFQMLREFILGVRPDVVVGHEEITNIEVLLALAGSGVPVIATEHNDPRQHRIGLRWQLLRRVLYPGTAAVVVLNESIAEWARARVPRWKVVTIPNPIGREDVRAVDVVGRSGNRVIGVGRLAPQKGFDLLIEAFAMASDAMPDWTLTIHGEGPERGRLEGLVKRCGLERRVCLPGVTRNPAAEYAGSDLMVVSSRYEGFCMVLVEAMAAGLPVISFDCPTGPGEIVRNGVDGVLVPPGDVRGLAGAMLELMRDPGRRRQLGEAAREVLGRYGSEVIVDRWEQLLAGIGPAG